MLPYVYGKFQSVFCNAIELLVAIKVTSILFYVIDIKILHISV